MDQVKRKPSLTEYSNVKTKKLRPIAIVDNQNSITFLEHLSNEIFYEIFDYLDGYDIYQTFFKLNTRFQQLVTCPSLPLRISFDEKSSLLEIKHVCKKVVIPNREHIFSLQFRDSKFINEIFTQCHIDSSFIRLQSFTLFEISPTQLTTTLVYLKSLPHLKSLRIYLKNGYSKYFSDIYRMIFQLPSLKTCQLSVLTGEKLNIFVPLRINEQFSTIERLIISHICDLNELNSILRHTPRLKHLTCQSLGESNKNIISAGSITLSNLIHININDCRLAFDEFENFIKKICSQLQVLHIGDYYSRKYIYPEHWECLIYRYMPYLIILKLKCNMFMNNNHFGHVYFDNLNNQFTPCRFIEHRWNFTLEVKPDRISYLISSTRQNSNDKSSRLFSSPIELSITNQSSTIWKSSFIDLLHPILSSIQFTNLHLFWSGMFIDTFIKLLNQLPNLNSLKLSSSLLFQMEESHIKIKDLDKLHCNNKITKLWVWMDMEHINTLIQLCSCIEHFEIHGIKHTEFKSLVRFILMKTKTHIFHLHSLHLYSYNANDRMLDELQQMINSENLLTNYMIKRYDNRFDLQWINLMK